MQLKKQDKPELVALITTSDYRDSQVVKHYGNMTMVKAMQTKAPTIYRWVKLNGEEQMVPAMAKLFIGASLYFEKPMSQDQAESIVHKLLADYELSNLKLEDLVVCCKEITESNQYGKLTPNKLLAHIKGYRKRRTEAAISDSLDSVQQSKMYGAELHERVHATFRKDGKDKGTAVDRTRTDVQKYYK